MTIFYDILGWLGAVIVLLAYGLNSAGKLSYNSKLYQFMNIFAGAILVAYTLHHGAFASAMINAVWTLIGFIALYNIKKKK